MSIAAWLFVVGLVSGAVVLGGLLLSIVRPTVRFWPHGDRNWTFWVGWVAWILYFGSLVGVAYVDWQTAFRPALVVEIVAAVLVVAGALVSTWAVWHLGFHESSGLSGELDTGGPYRYSRNPQYVGYVTMLVGSGVIAGSWLVAVLVIIGIAWFLLAPLAEEPWLREQYGEAYVKYAESVPRFVGTGSKRDLPNDRARQSNEEDE